MEDPGSAIHDFEGQDQNASEKGVTKEQSPVIDKHEVKSSAGILGDTGAEVQKILEKFGDVHSILLSKRRSMEVFTKESLKDSTQKIEELWKTYQSKRQKVNSEFSEKFETVFEQWNLHKQELEEETKEVAVASHYVALHDLELTMYAKLALTSQKSNFFYIQSAVITDVCHHASVKVLVLGGLTQVFLRQPYSGVLMGEAPMSERISSPS
ncbi:synaptonemal complex protein 3-like isoform X2 [Nannospalax galili]|uniref:synaptonemal complex protein 3-like isoform X2 n=1 Tax=Nannospalax galili TaxID=1026970 RepID=UPI00111C14A4|nr:synaptonemal complex protein 3-like isoform X2 [Nannospalax galili]